VFTRKTYETIIHLFLKDPANCHRPKEYRLAKFMLKMIPDLNFWRTVDFEPVSSLTYFLTKENKEMYLDEYKRYKRMSKFNPDKIKEKTYKLGKEKAGEDLNLKPNKKLNLLNFIKHGPKKEN
jgi:hypothetical protein